MALQNKHLNKNIFETFGLDSNEARTFWLHDDDSTAYNAKETVVLDEEHDYGVWDGRADALKQHHTIEIQYPAPELLRDTTEVFTLNRPRNAERRYAPHPLIRDSKIMSVAARDGLVDNGFYSVYRCDQPRPDISIRNIARTDLFADTEEATQCHGVTILSAVVFRDTFRPEHGPLIRVRRSTRFRWETFVDHDDQDYELPLRDFMAASVRPAWYRDLNHMICIESDRAARFIATKLQHYRITGAPRADLQEVHFKFRQCFGRPARCTEDLEGFLPHIVKPYKASVFQRTPNCVFCFEKCLKGVNLPCSPEHVSHWECLMTLCGENDIAHVSCRTCKARLFTGTDAVNSLKLNIHNGIFYNDDRYSRWENFEKSCADLDSTEASTNETQILITRDFMITLWQKIVDFGIEANVPEHLHFDRPDEYLLLEAVIDTQLTRLEGVTTAIWAIERWIKRRVFFQFRHEFLKSKLDHSLSSDAKNRMNKHNFMRQVLRKGWYDAYLRNLNRFLQFLSQRVCVCPAGHESMYHSHGGREYYNPSVVAREQSEVTPARASVYEWQESEPARKMMQEFLKEVGRGDVEAGRDIPRG